jgi:GNAT superfamily N-acetyltransferase
MEAAVASVRPAEAGDAARMAELAGQLGYRVTLDELAARLPAVAASDSDTLLVAVDERDVPVGWIHVEVKRTLLAPLSAQVMGLVVDEAARSRGIGARLLEGGEAWARERGCSLILVGTRVTRERAHRFYRRQGYGLLKTSHFFEKRL